MIEVTGLKKDYEGFAALRGITFQVRQGDIFGFIGPNGAGKTTTMRILSTLLEPTEGTILVDGQDVVRHPLRVRRLIGYMPDQFGVYEGITVWEYLDFFSASYGLDPANRRRLLDGILELTDLSSVRDRLAGTLSKGMRQRLCVAKTLVHDPKVLVLDEPASGLDPRARIEFRALLRELRSMGKTIFLSSHILTELSDVCNSVAILEKGSLVVSGDIEQIKRALQPARGFTLSVFEKPESAAAALREIASASQIRADGEGRVTFQFDGGEKEVAELLRSLVNRGIPVTGLQETRRDLESLFMQLTKGEVA